jgi:hypothetical protein
VQNSSLTAKPCKRRDGVGSREPFIGPRQQPHEQCRPVTLTGFIRDEVLANFDCDVRQLALLAMNGDGVIPAFEDPDS